MYSHVFTKLQGDSIRTSCLPCIGGPHTLNIIGRTGSYGFIRNFHGLHTQRHAAVGWKEGNIKVKYLSILFPIDFTHIPESYFICKDCHNACEEALVKIYILIARFMGPTWGLPGADRTQVGPMLVTWTNMGPTWVLSAPGGPHVGHMNLAIWVAIVWKGKRIL